MSPGTAAVVFSIVILGLYWLDRDRSERISRATWIPVVWLGLAGSRSVTQWLGINAIASSDEMLEGSPIDRLVYTGLLAVGLAIVVGRRKQVGRILRENGPLVLFFAYCAASLLWSDFPAVAFKRWIKALGDLIMVMIVLTDPEPLNAVKRLLTRTSFLLIPLSILFIKYYPDFGKGYGRWDGVAFFTGVTTNKNTLGVICLLFGLGSLWRILEWRRRRDGIGRTRWPIAHAVILAMVFWLFSMANSMTSLLSFVLGSGVLVAANSDAMRRRPAVVHLLVGAVLLGSVSVLFLGVSPGALEAVGRDDTLTDRTAVWSDVLSLVTNPLLGAGFDSFWLGRRLDTMWSLYSWRPNQAHNGYLEVFLNLGWMGVALLLAVLTTAYRTVMAAYRRDLPTGTLWLAYFVVVMIYNYTEAAFFRMMAPAWILLLVAITRVPAVPISESPSVDTAAARIRPRVEPHTRALLRVPVSRESAVKTTS